MEIATLLIGKLYCLISKGTQIIFDPFDVEWFDTRLDIILGIQDSSFRNEFAHFPTAAFNEFKEWKTATFSIFFLREIS